MISIVDFLETKLPPHTWYGANINAIGMAPKKYGLQSWTIKKIGPASSLITICSEIDQFLSGVFFAIQGDPQHEIINIEIDTEDPPFRTLNIEGILIEIRAFDTSFFDFFAENEQIIKELLEQFKSHVKQDNKYTWNDQVSIKKEAPKECHPGEVAVVCGMTKITFEEIAKKYHSKVGDWIYTVDFGDGIFIEIPESYLEK
jgi:hypothetical protein